MKRVVFNVVSTLVLILLFAVSCSKDPITRIPTPSVPVPEPNVPSGVFRFTTNVNLTGEPYHSSNLKAVVTVINNKNEEVLKDTSVTLEIAGNIKTASLTLPVGDYQLTSFRLVYGNVNTHFAAPIKNSAKAALVQKPLPINFKVTTTLADVPVEALKVNGAKPAMFGYPAGAFDDNQQENSQYFNMKIKAVVQVGAVVYDSIPASLTLTTFDSKGEMTTSYVPLKAGVNEVPLLKSASRFTFNVSKWGVSEEKTLDRTSINEETVYTFGGDKAAKKLKSEVFFNMVNGNYVSFSKKDYTYDASGKLTQVKLYLRNNDNVAYVAQTEHLEYSGEQVTRINRFNEQNIPAGYTQFTYDGQGKIMQMTEKVNGNETNVRVVYTNGQRPEVRLYYQFSNGTPDRRYFKVYAAGNMVEAISDLAEHTNSAEAYNYDFNINPYIYINYPDIHLSNSSKNNTTSILNPPLYDGGGIAEIGTFSYNYDNDGYPKDMIRTVRAANGHVFSTTKTVYVY